MRKPVFVGPTAMVSLAGARYSMSPEATGCSGTAYLLPERVRIEAGRHVSEHPRLPSGQKSVLPEHRSERLARVSGRRGKQYLKRQDLLDLGEVALVLIDEIVHRRPSAWVDDINELHEVLQVHGEGPLLLAMHMAVAAGELECAASALTPCVGTASPLPGGSLRPPDRPPRPRRS